MIAVSSVACPEMIVSERREDEAGFCFWPNNHRDRDKTEGTQITRTNKGALSVEKRKSVR